MCGRGELIWQGVDGGGRAFVCVYVCAHGGKVWPGLRVSTEITVSERKKKFCGVAGREGKERKGKERKGKERKGGDEEEEEGRDHLVMICVY